MPKQIVFDQFDNILVELNYPNSELPQPAGLISSVTVERRKSYT